MHQRAKSRVHGWRIEHKSWSVLLSVHLCDNSNFEPGQVLSLYLVFVFIIVTR
jgi:hypothetical protein